MPTVLPRSLSTCSEEHQPLVSGILGEMGGSKAGAKCPPQTSTGIDYPSNIRSEIFLIALNRNKNKQTNKKKTVQDRGEKYFSKV